MDNQADLVCKYVARRLSYWQNSKNEHAVRAELAELRHCIGTIPGERPEIWNLLFDGLPEALMSRSGQPTKAEWAIFTVLTLYALHQQGSDMPMHMVGNSFGAAVRRLAANEDELNAVNRRFRSVVSASDMRECAYYMRGLIQMLRTKDIPLDYIRLSKDLYWFQNKEYSFQTKLSWGQDFYGYRQEENNSEDIEEEENHE